MGGDDGGVIPGITPPSRVMGIVRPRRNQVAAAQAASAPAPGSGAAAKGTLLSPSQKRANHIQSEQKRRANIRRGYEALCEVVPALREAIRAEEERELAKDAPENGEEPAKGNGKGNGKGDGRGISFHSVTLIYLFFKEFFLKKILYVSYLIIFIFLIYKFFLII